MRFILAVFAVACTASSAFGQIIRGPRGNEPPWVFSATVGFMSAETIIDGSSGSAWDFGSALQYRAAVERRVADQLAVGISVARASVPVRYGQIAGAAGSTPCSGPNPVSCDAKADVSTIAASFTTGGRYGLHQIINLGLGLTFFQNFRQDLNGQPLAPISGDKDFFLNLGFGIGYGISDHFAVQIVQDASYIVHQRTGLSANRSTFHRIYVTRLGLRIAVGG